MVERGQDACMDPAKASHRVAPSISEAQAPPEHLETAPGVEGQLQSASEVATEEKERAVSMLEAVKAEAAGVRAEAARHLEEKDRALQEQLTKLEELRKEAEMAEHAEIASQKELKELKLQMLMLRDKLDHERKMHEVEMQQLQESHESKIAKRVHLMQQQHDEQSSAARAHLEQVQLDLCSAHDDIAKGELQLRAVRSSEAKQRQANDLLSSSNAELQRAVNARKGDEVALGQLSLLELDSLLQEVPNAFARIQAHKVSREAEQLRQQVARQECVVCMEVFQESYAFVPCGHQCCCRACGQKVMDGRRKCPMCNTECTLHMRVHTN
uniref:RING-type domain-containing protein n=1 Tax=Haptolina ericina TaxID=156174 RepID=A0A6T9JS59_9EUKA